MGETWQRAVAAGLEALAFSILKRIVMGETQAAPLKPGQRARVFQYPQADRDG